MPGSDVEVVVIGGGAAGIAAAQRLRRASIDCLLVEARPRLGGRAWTITASGVALDLGCGWLHSADRNPWVSVAEEQGASIDKTPPPWMRAGLEYEGFSRAEQQEFRAALDAFFERLEQAAQREPDVAAVTLLDPECRWNRLINSIFTFISGGDLDRLSIKDLDRYADSGINWRVVEGYGAIISGYGANLQATLNCEVRGIDHRGQRLLVETSKGAVAADQVIVTVPSALIASERLRFTPALPAKVRAAGGLPLGLADKLFMSLDRAEEFENNVRLFGRTDSGGTGGFHFRPFGRPMIEGYFAGKLASDLEASGDGAFFDFALLQLTAVLGSEFAKRLKPIRVHRWGHDPFALGSYSFAVPGSADCRAVLAEPVDDRLFFAGEACSKHDFSTAHGAWHTGVAAADGVIAVRQAAQRRIS